MQNEECIPRTKDFIGPSCLTLQIDNLLVKSPININILNKKLKQRNNYKIEFDIKKSNVMQLLKLKLKRNLENSFGIHHVTEYQSIYGLVKARYQILRDMPPEYDFNAQCNIVSSSFLPIFFVSSKIDKNISKLPKLSCLCILVLL